MAVIGPNANDVDVLLGNYNGEPSAPVTPLEGIRRKVGRRHAGDLRARQRPGRQRAELRGHPASALFTSNGAGRNGLNGEYYKPPISMASCIGSASMTFPDSGKLVGESRRIAKPLFTRVDPHVDFRWWDGAPRAGHE